jgi:hypothetical protein
VQKKFAESKQAFINALEINPLNYFALGGLATKYKELRENGLSSSYTAKLTDLRNQYFNPATTKNYLSLKRILDKRKIKLVCAQYPMRNIAPLKEIFQDEPQGSVIFVDNEKIFTDGVQKHGYEEYFKDMFAGDFGHCTENGNRLLADNIANTIITEFFNK